MPITKFPVELLTELGRESAEMLLKDKNFWLQKKLDGHRRQFELLDGTLTSYNRNGQSVSYAIAQLVHMVRFCAHFALFSLPVT